MAWIRGMSWVTSLRLPVSDTCNGMPGPSVIRWCFELVRARSTGLGSVSAAFEDRDTAVDHALDQSNAPAPPRSASSCSGRRCQTPAVCIP